MSFLLRKCIFHRINGIIYHFVIDTLLSISIVQSIYDSDADVSAAVRHFEPNINILNFMETIKSMNKIDK